jgi:uncharacterized membrane protein
MQLLSDLLESWRDPHMRHAMLVHLPIVAGLFGVPLVLALLLTGARVTSVKIAALVAFALASLGAALAAQAGESAEERVEKRGLSVVEKQAVHEHEELGERGWIWPLIPAALVGVTLIPSKRRAVPMAAAGLAMAASLGVAWWVVSTSHSGGRLVYVHGVGVPPRADAPVDRD